MCKVGCSEDLNRLVCVKRADHLSLTAEPVGRVLSPFELGDEEDLAARANRLEIGGLVDGAVDRDGGFFFEVMAEAGVELVHRLYDAAQVAGLDLKFVHPAGVAAAEPGGEHNPGGHCAALLI